MKNLKNILKPTKKFNYKKENFLTNNLVFRLLKLDYTYYSVYFNFLWAFIAFIAIGFTQYNNKTAFDYEKYVLFFIFVGLFGPLAAFYACSNLISNKKRDGEMLLLFTHQYGRKKILKSSIMAAIVHIILYGLFCFAVFTLASGLNSLRFPNPTDASSGWQTPQKILSLYGKLELQMLKIFAVYLIYSICVGLPIFLFTSLKLKPATHSLLSIGMVGFTFIMIFLPLLVNISGNTKLRINLQLILGLFNPLIYAMTIFLLIFNVETFFAFTLSSTVKHSPLTSTTRDLYIAFDIILLLLFLSLIFVIYRKSVKKLAII